MIRDEQHEQALAEHAASYLKALEAYEIAKSNLDLSKKHLIAEFPKHIGTFEVEAQGTTIIVKRDERWKWDTEKLATIFAGEIPAHVKATLSVDKRVFKKLSQEEQDQLSPALTVVDAAPTIEVRQ